MSEQPTENLPKRWHAAPISWKLLGATAVVGAVAAVIAIVGLKRIQTLNQNLTQTVDFLATNVTLASLLKQDLVMATRAERNLILARSDEEIERFGETVDTVAATMDERLKDLHQLMVDDDQRLLTQFSEQWDKWLANHNAVRRFTALDSDRRAHSVSIGEAQQAIDRLTEAIHVIVQRYQQALGDAERTEDYRQSATAAKKLKLAEEVLRAALEMQRAEKNLILAQSEEEARRYEAQFDPLTSKIEARIEQLGDAAGEENEQSVREVKRAFADYRSANNSIRAVAGEKTNLMAYHLVYDVGVPIAAECESLLDQLIEQNEQHMQEYRRKGQLAYRNARSTLLSISVLGILVSVAFSFFTGQSIARRLSALSNYADSIQRTGDLSKPLPHLGSDEVGRVAESFDHMRESLHERTLTVRENTARLTELSETLAAKNNEIEQFVYTVSHDLKSPLVSCKGLLGLLREDVADRNYDAILDSADRLDQATDQLNHTIDDLLMLSRIGRKKLDLKEVDVRQLVEELLDELADRMAEANAVVEVHAELPRAIADRSDLRRVFENLLTNAIKYGDDGAELKIAVGGLETNGEVRFFVRDSGPGIDPKYHQRIFGLFQRLDTDSPGTGLGLASVAKIMSMHGGRTWVESDVGQGATFWIAFPRQPRRPFA